MGAWERLSAADASNLAFEHDGQAYSIGLVGLLDGELPVEGLRSLLAPRIAAIPQLNRRVHLTHWGQGLPVWVPCPAVPRLHVRGGPALGDHAGLAALAGALVAEPLPRDRPLWDLTLCAGPGPATTSAVLRLHHALADGVSGVGVLQGLFDGAPIVPGPGITAGPEPTGRQLTVDAWQSRAAAVRAWLSHLRRWPATVPTALPSALRTARTGAVRTAVTLRGGMPPTSLLGPIGPGRDVHFTVVDLAPLRAAAHAQGATVNDVLLTAVAAGARALLVARGEPVPADLPTSVPVSLRRGTAGGGIEDNVEGNRVGVMLVRLPLTGEDEGERVRRVADRTRTAKEEARRAGTFELTRSRLGTRLFDVIARHQHTVGMFVTNVPGPPEPLRLGGAELRAAWPLSSIGGNVRLAVAALSYAGRLHVTVTCDSASCPDAWVFSDTVAAVLSGLPANEARITDLGPGV